MDKQLERIIWKNQSWMKQNGIEITPEKIGDSFVVNSFKEFSYGDGNEKLQKFLFDKLNELESRGYITNEQKQIINAYSIGRPMESNILRSPISFYKI